MNCRVAVRVFERRDLPGILRIERESFVQDAWPREVFLEYASTAPELFLVAVMARRIAGYITASMTRGGAEIASLAVRPAYRKVGVATELLKAEIKRVRHAGARAAWLMVRRENGEAIRLYQQLGFVRTATVPDYYDDHSPGWRMRITFPHREPEARKSTA